MNFSEAKANNIKPLRLQLQEQSDSYNTQLSLQEIKLQKQEKICTVIRLITQTIAFAGFSVIWLLTILQQVAAITVIGFVFANLFLISHAVLFYFKTKLEVLKMQNKATQEACDKLAAIENNMVIMYGEITHKESE